MQRDARKVTHEQGLWVGNIFNPVQIVDEYGRPMFGAYGNGKTYFVDPVNGNDNKTGLTRADALATKQAAVDKCTDGAGDTIIVLPGAENVATATIFNKSGLTVMASEYGMNPFNPERFYHTGINASTGVACYDGGPSAIFKRPTAIYGITFIGGKSSVQTYAPGTAGNHYAESVTESPACVAIAGGGSYYGGYNFFKCCKFVGWGVTRNGIEQAAGGYNCFESCWFEGLTAGYAPRVNGYGNPNYDQLINCHFVGCTAGIELFEPGTNAVTPSYALWKGNTFLACTKALDLNGNSGCTGLIADNYFPSFTKDTFADVNLAGVQSAGFGVVNNHYEET